MALQRPAYFVCILLFALSQPSKGFSKAHSSSLPGNQTADHPQFTVRRSLLLNDNAVNTVDEDHHHVVHFRQNKSLTRKQNSRFLNLFSVIDIPNTACQSSQKPLRELNGTCYHPNQCAKMGGLGHGKCADGYGVCCFFQLSCGGKTAQPVSYFESPKFPVPIQEKLDCTLVVELLPATQQVLLEFEAMELRPPVNGDCMDDRFVVSGQNVNSQVPILCGINTGQHMYVDVSESPQRQLFLTVVSNLVDNRLFSVRIVQLSEARAPQGCLQYHQELSGIIESFNYNMASASISLKYPQYMNNLNYAICIKRNLGYCTLTYSNQRRDAEDEYDFQLLNVDEEGHSVIPPRQAGAEIYNCPDDFIIVNGIRLCGEKLNDGARSEDFSQNFPVTDLTAGPLVLQVRTNNIVAGKGFRLAYKQNLC